MLPLCYVACVTECVTQRVTPVLLFSLPCKKHEKKLRLVVCVCQIQDLRSRAPSHARHIRRALSSSETLLGTRSTAYQNVNVNDASFSMNVNATYRRLCPPVRSKRAAAQPSKGQQQACGCTTQQRATAKQQKACGWHNPWFNIWSYALMIIKQHQKV